MWKRETVPVSLKIPIMPSHCNLCVNERQITIQEQTSQPSQSPCIVAYLTLNANTVTIFR